MCLLTAKAAGASSVVITGGCGQEERGRGAGGCSQEERGEGCWWVWLARPRGEGEGCWWVWLARPRGEGGGVLVGVAS